ncbi:MAG: prepilin-type N-terminal cleavage/methylation domain-containing protein [Deltaproteobacteria bacterium]|nr:prepilin-type N-terminal cleavage/methylation domain-containing protein [Deltaproteobacteria bacterium]
MTNFQIIRDVFVQRFGSTRALSGVARRGYTLIEVIVSMAIGLFVVAAAVSLVTMQTRVQGDTTSRIDMNMSANVGLTLLKNDIEHAGLGLGYASDGRFPGIRRGTFQVRGGAEFESNDFSLSLTEGGERPTDDLGILYTEGDFRTIAHFASSFAEICAGAALEAGDSAVLMSQGYVYAHTVSITSIGPTTCTSGQCVEGCDTITWTNDPTFVSDDSAPSASYSGGELAARFKEVVWFVTADADGAGVLRRAAVTENETCAARDETCGALMAHDVETLQVRVLQWSPASMAWEDRTTETSITDRDRVRIDVELVLRSRTPDQREHDPVSLDLESGRCVPDGCQRDHYARQAVRLSVEVRNSGRMQML